MDKSLDDIISAKPRARRGAPRRGGARAQVLGKPAVTPAQRARAAVPAANGAKVSAGGVAASPADKIIVSNLPPDVNEAQIKELFSSTVGPLRDVTLHYDASGRSKGVASVTFQKKSDGTKAYQQYNNRLIDGKRPMKIEIIVDPAARPVPLASRVAPAVAATNGVQTHPARTSAGGRGRGRRGRVGGGGARKSERPAKSAADLDAEMEDYTAANAPTAAV